MNNWYKAGIMKIFAEKFMKCVNTEKVSDK